MQDIITGIFIQFENAINEGEVVTAGGITGVVERLSIRSLGLRDLQGVYHIVPFSSVDAVSNFMRGFGYHVAEIGIAYRENIDEAKAVMHAAFDELCQDPEIGPAIIAPLDWHGLTAFGNSAIMLRARIKTLPGQQWAAGRAYNAIIKRRFDEAGIEIPFPHMTLYFGQDKQGTAPPLRAAFEPEALARAGESLTPRQTTAPAHPAAGPRGGRQARGRPRARRRRACGCRRPCKGLRWPAKAGPACAGGHAIPVRPVAFGRGPAQISPSRRATRQLHGPSFDLRAAPLADLGARDERKARPVFRAGYGRERSLERALPVAVAADVG